MERIEEVGRKMIPTYNECLEIVKANDSFFMSIVEVQGYKVVMFNYRIASYGDFNCPIKDKPEIKAYELRGLTFVQQNDGSMKRFIMLHKFFNMGETEGYLLKDVKDKKIVSVQNKFDGSLIRFIRLPNGNVVAKTKMSFDNDQSRMAQEIYDNDEKLQEFINTSLKLNRSALFEFVGPSNRIVLRYKEHKLVLLQERSENGKYRNIELVNKIYGINIAEAEEYPDYTVEDLKERAKTEENIEGWVVTLDDGQILKIKTAQYFQLHHLRTNCMDKENYIIQAIIDENVDDIFAQLDENDDDVRDNIRDIEKKISQYYNTTASKIYDTVFYEFDPNKRKKFALKYKDTPEFPMMMALVAKGEVTVQNATDVVKEHILKRTKKLIGAVKFLNDLDK